MDAGPSLRQALSLDPASAAAAAASAREALSGPASPAQPSRASASPVDVPRARSAGARSVRCARGRLGHALPAPTSGQLGAAERSNRRAPSGWHGRSAWTRMGQGSRADPSHELPEACTWPQESQPEFGRRPSEPSCSRPALSRACAQDRQDPGAPAWTWAQSRSAPRDRPARA